MPPTRAGRLPVPLSSFIGRDRELAAARRFLEQPHVRLLTLTGPGGVGKTRLALRLAADVAERFANDVHFVGLATITDASLVLPTIAQTLGILDTGERSIQDVLATALGERELLLLLDNLEQVVTCGPQLATLLVDCPALTMLVTSRAALRVQGEQEFPVPPLDLPTADASVEQPASVRLFVQRAQAVNPSLALTDETMTAIRVICVQLDGLPLAIELAAARCNVLPPQALLPRLSDRLRILTGGATDAPARHQTMRATITWSCDLLSPVEQRAFGQLAVFVGGCTLEAVEAVVRAGDDVVLLDVVTSLVEKHLLRQTVEQDGTPRFGMLETIRAVAQEQLVAGLDVDEVRARHAAWYHALASHLWVGLGGAPQVEALATATREIDNFRAAMDWSLGGEHPNLGGYIAGTLGQFWYLHGNWSEGYAWMQRALAREDELDPTTLGYVCTGFAFLAMARRDWDTASRLAQRGIDAWTAAGMDGSDAFGRVLIVHGSIAVDTGDDALAERHILAGCDLMRRHGNEAVAGLALAVLGRLAHRQGDPERAAQLHREALASHERFDNRYGRAGSLNGLARIALERGACAQAAALFAEALSLWWEQGARAQCLGPVRGLADVASRVGQPALGVRLLAATESLGKAFGSVLTGDASWRFIHRIEQLRQEMSEADFAAAWEAGQAMIIEDVLCIAHRLVEAARAAGSLDEGQAVTSPALAMLTPRELEVLRLIALGRSNPEIAEALFISRRTVTTHVTHIFDKLGLNSRAAAAAYAAQHGLV